MPGRSGWRLGRRRCYPRIFSSSVPLLSQARSLFFVVFALKGDKVTRVDYGHRVLMDVLGAARRPDSCAVMLLDMSAAESFCDEYRRKRGTALTSLHLILKAFALMLEKYPWMNCMIDGYRIIYPSSVDIGVSVAAGESITPVVVIENANKKSLSEIGEELRMKAGEAIQREKENLERLNRIGRWIPLGFLRRPIVRFVANHYRVRRMVIGTAQVTSLGFKDLAFHLPSHMGTSVLLSVGGVSKRPAVVGDKIEIRPTVYVAFQVDGRVVPAIRGMAAFRRFRLLIEHPEKLDDPGRKEISSRR